MYMCECVWGRSDECVCILYMCECVWGSSVLWHTHQKTVSKSWFSLSTMWVPGIEPRYSGLLASLLSDLLSLLTAFQVPVWNQIFSALNFRASEPTSMLWHLRFPDCFARRCVSYLPQHCANLSQGHLLSATTRCQLFKGNWKLPKLNSHSKVKVKFQKEREKKQQPST